MAAMFLSVTSTAPSATDLGFLLHKHPDRVQTLDLPVGKVTIWYPQADADRCTVALLLEVDPIALVRDRRFGADGFALGQYVNDRPYAASSMLATALGKAFGTARSGVCKNRPDLEGSILPLEVRLPALPYFGELDVIDALFAPLGWTVAASVAPLDPTRPDWGSSRYADVTLTGSLTLAAALGHLYVLLPVLDGAKHYWVTRDEVDKLLHNAEAWLPTHPERELITRRYLAHRTPFVTDALERLDALDDQPEAEQIDEVEESDDPEAGKAVPLRFQRRDAVLQALSDVGAARVVDLGCGSGALLVALRDDHRFTEIVGVDVSLAALEQAERRLRLHRMPQRQADRFTLLQGSVTYLDDRLKGFDAIVLMEVIEHLDADRLPSLEASVFGAARPGAVVVTTPNAEYNAVWESLPAGQFRHRDHRFEWSWAEFEAWAHRVAAEHGYSVEFRPVGGVHEELGPPTQLALFRAQVAR